MLMLLMDHPFTSSMAWYCLWYWICEIRILLLEWNHILFMRDVIWFKILRNKMWFLSGSTYAGAFVFWCCRATILTASVFNSLSFEGFQVAQQCHLMLPQQEKARQGPSVAEGALIVGWLESFDWLYDAVGGSWNFLPHTCGHICDWIRLFLCRQNVCHCSHSLSMNNLKLYVSAFVLLLFLIVFAEGWFHSSEKSTKGLPSCFSRCLM